MKPHGDTPLAAAGARIEEANAAVVLVHGRGATAESILDLRRELTFPKVAYLAPQAAGQTWYPQSFLAPIEANEPGISSGLARLAGVLEELADGGVPAEKVMLLGFSQGACLTSEFAFRHPRRYGAVVAFTGGLIGPPGMPREVNGKLDGTPVFLGSADPDPHVPWARVEETARIFEEMGAQVDLRRFPGMPHTVNREELEAARALLAPLAGAEP